MIARVDAGSGTLGSGAASVGFVPKRSFSGIAVVVVMHLALFWALANGLAQRVVEVVRSPIQTKLLDETPSEPPPPPPKLPPPPVQPPPTVAPVPVPVVLPQTPPPMPVPAPPPPAPAPPPPAAPPPPEAAPRVTAPAPVAAPAANSTRSPEEIYLGTLQGYLNSIKRYPTSREARQLKPQGTVRIWLELDRAGQLVGAGVEASSGSLMLDNEALRTVRNGRFPPFPTEAFANQNTRRFVVPIEYLVPGT